MMDEDCSAVAVVDGAGRALGVVTDRDVCRAVYELGCTLADLTVRRVMAKPPAQPVPAVPARRPRGAARDDRWGGPLTVNDIVEMVGAPSRGHRDH